MEKLGVYGPGLAGPEDAIVEPLWAGPGVVADGVPTGDWTLDAVEEIRISDGLDLMLDDEALEL